LVNIERQYRSRIQIARDILAVTKNGSRKTRIMYQGNLSFSLLQKYLDMLLNLGLIEVRGDSEKSYVATERGLQFLEDYSEFQKYSQMIEEKRRVLESTLPA
jgi:predicted transcriptional regulator